MQLQEALNKTYNNPTDFKTWEILSNLDIELECRFVKYKSSSNWYAVKKQADIFNMYRETHKENPLEFRIKK